MKIVSYLLRLPLIFWHRFLSPMLPPTCRFYPSCSLYAVEALEKHRLHRALWLIVCRVGSCHPLHPGGYDPVPEPGVKGETEAGAPR